MMTLSVMTLGVMPFSVMRLNKIIIMTLSTMTALSMTTLSRMALCITTLNKKHIDDGTEQNDILYTVTQYDNQKA
jgi:hypothetical protein